MFRKTRSSSIQIFNSSKDLPAGWDNLVPEGHYLERASLAVSERSALPDVAFIYVLVYINKIAVAAASFQTLQFTPQHLNSALAKPRDYLLWRAFTATLRPVLLVAGHLFRHDVCSYYWAGTVAPFDAFQLYRRAIDAARQRSCAMAVLVKDVDTRLVDYFQHHAPRYLLLRNDISMEMEIPAEWSNLPDYEKALKHKYAQRFRKIRQPWQALRVQELSPDELRERQTQVYSLYRQVADRQQVRIGFLSPGYLLQLKEHHGDTLKVWAVMEGDEMIAFFSAWVKGDAFDMFYIGLDYEKNAQYQLYFNMLFFATGQAILLGKAKLILGRTALDAKARLGARPRYLHTFLFIKNGIIRQQIMNMQEQQSSGEGEWEQRHPFKQQGGWDLI